MNKLNNLIKKVINIEPTYAVSKTLKDDLLKDLYKIKEEVDSKEKNTKTFQEIQLANKNNYIESLKNKIDYLENFIIRLARESQDL